MKVLIACEESQAVCKEFRKLGIDAYSCDILPCSGGHQEWHIQDDVLKVINREHWDCMIAFPPCTHLAVSGAAWFEQKRKDGRQKEGIDFFMAMVNARIKYKAIENPVGIMSKIYRKPNQIIQPYYFGDDEQKTTCLWLYGLPKLYHNSKPNLFDNNVTHVKPYFKISKTGNKYTRIHSLGGGKGHERSKTFPGIAKAMAEQWGKFLLEKMH